MMKFVLMFMAILSVGFAHHGIKSEHTRALDDDLAELIELLPTIEIAEILALYLVEDDQVQEVAAFLISDEFEAMVFAMDAEPSFVAILDFLEAEGVNIYDFLNKIRAILGIPDITRLTATIPRSVQKGWREMWEEILAVLPLDDLYNFHCKKVAAGEEWATLYEHLSGEEFRGLINAFRVTDSWQDVKTKLAEYDVHTDLIVAAIQRFFNWDEDTTEYCIDYVPKKLERNHYKSPKL